MEAVFNHIERLKGKPHHVKKHLSLLYAAVAAGAIALVWLAINLSTGAFAIANSTFAESTTQAPVVAVPASGGAGLAGAAGASADENAPAHIEIVNTTPAPAAKAEPTTIPF